MSTSDCKVPFWADGGYRAITNLVQQGCLGRPGGLLRPDGGHFDTASIGTLEGISSRDTAIQPSHMSKETQATARDDVPNGI